MLPIQVLPRNMERTSGGSVTTSMMVSRLNRSDKRLSEATSLSRKYMKKMMPRPKSICKDDSFILGVFGTGHRA